MDATIQQQLLLDQQYRALAMVADTSEALDRKLGAFFASGMGATGAAALAAFLSAGRIDVASEVGAQVFAALLLVILLLQAAITVVTWRAWRPTDFPVLRLQGEGEGPKAAFAKVLSVEPQEAMTNCIAAAMLSSQLIESTSKSKAEAVVASGRLFLVQLLCVTVAMMLRLLALASF